MAYKLKYPDHVFLLRGNHESSEMNDGGGFRDECLKYYSESLYNDFQSLFGPDIVEEFMLRFDFDLIVRGHECCDGYCFAFDRKLVTVFSASNYCGVEQNAAGILFIDANLSCRFVLIRETKPMRRNSVLKPDTLEIINK